MDKLTATDQNIIIVGGGAAGLMAAYTAADNGGKVTLIERNRFLGRKLLITGAGRCNVTNASDIQELIANIPGNGRFLYGAFQRFGPGELMRFVEETLGVPLKVERGKRVFPVSDRAQDLVAAFERAIRAKGVQVLTETRVQHILVEAGRVVGVADVEGRTYPGNHVIVATGGASYPGTGSTGDGHRLAEEVGHTVKPIFPSLVPLETLEDWPKRVEGLTLNNVNVSCYHRGKKLHAEFGDLLFTGFGVSGPTVLSLSRSVVPAVLDDPASVTLVIDLKPALSMEELDRRIQRDFAKFTNKLFKNALDELLPKSLIPVMVDLSEIDPLKPVHQITKEERARLVRLFKGLTLTVTKSRSFFEAIVTAGGITVKEIDPKTMESKLVKGLYFVGEVVDVDGYTGGFNLQIAFSMGYVAGKAVTAAGNSRI